MKNVLDFDFMVELFLGKRKKYFSFFFEKKCVKILREYQILGW